MNTNPKAKRILCFGDSNVWGYVSGSNHNRYSPDVRWPGHLQNLLGGNYEIIEEGLNSRGVSMGDPRPGKEGRSAKEYIVPCLDSHDPLDLVIILLGTNETKSVFGLTAEQISGNLLELLNVIISRNSQFRTQKPKVLLISPILINENTEYCLKGDKYKGASEKIVELRKLLRGLADELAISYLELSRNVEPGPDGVHLTEKSHKKIALLVKNRVLDLL